jgi:sortase A
LSSSSTTATTQPAVAEAPTQAQPTKEAPPSPTPTSGLVLPLQPTAAPAQPSPTPTQQHPVQVEAALLQPTPTPMTLPEYAIPTPAVRPTLGPNGIPADDSPATRIVIPAMKLDTVVKFVPYSGDTWLIGGLRWEVAWMGDTSWPGLGGNTGLAGHVDFADGSAGPFWNLNALKPGDEIAVYTQQHIFIYQVRNQATVDDSDMSVIDATQNPQITLITCTDWDTSLHLYLKRLVVFADLVDIRPLT